MGSTELRGVLITGSSGQVGGELVQAFELLAHRFDPVHAPLRAELDLGSPASVRAAVQRFRPRWIVNAAAYTAVDRAESEPEAAYAINATAVRILGEEARKLGSAVLHFSTDYVFAGEGDSWHCETDPTAPRSVYGASKLAGEQALAESGAAYLIFRTSWVYGATGKNFLLTILRLARERPELKIVADQHGAPTWSRELARMAVAVIEQCESGAEGRDLTEGVREVEGLYHAACADETTWFGFAEEALRLVRATEPGTNFAELIPIATSEYPAAAARPRNSRLNSDKLARAFGLRMMDWRAALAAVMVEVHAPTEPSVDTLD